MITLTSVYKSYGTFKAVLDLSFEVERGEIIGLVGPNGAGKTTTMKMITGFLVASFGVVKVAGQDVAKFPERAQRVIGYLPEHNPLYPEMLVRDYLRFVGRMRDLSGRDLKDRFDKVVADCHLQEKVSSPISTLSKGFKQGVGIAQAMIHDPQVLILDEPTSGLDPNQIVDIRRLIAQLGVDKTVILSTHILSEVEETCSRAIMLVGGKLALDDTISSLSGANTLRITVNKSEKTVLGALKEVDFAGEAQWLGSESGCHTYLVESACGKDIAACLFKLAADQDWVLSHLARNKTTLEDTFRSISQKEGAKL